MGIKDIFGKAKIAAKKLVPKYNTTWSGLGTGDYNPDTVGLDTYMDMIQQDAQIRAGTDFLKILTIGSGYTLTVDEDVDEEVAKFVQGCFDDFGYQEQDFADALDEILTAYWAGYSVSEMIPYYDTKVNKIRIYRFSTADPRTFANGLITTSGGELIAVKQTQPLSGRYGVDDEKKTEYTSSELKVFDKYKKMYFDSPAGNAGVPAGSIPVNDVIYFSVNQTFGNAYGESFLRPCYKNWFSKDNLIRFWNIALERYGVPFTVGKSPNPDDKDQILSVINSIQPMTGVYLSDQAEIEVHETKKSAQDFMSAIAYHDQQILLRLLIPSLTLQQEKVGSYSLGEVHFTVFLMRLARLRNDVEKLMQRKVVKKLVEWNFGDVPLPKFTFNEIKHQDTSKIADIIEKMINSQVVGPDEEWIRDKLNFPQIYGGKVVKKKEDDKGDRKGDGTDDK